MRNCAVSGTNIAKLARMVTKAGGRIDLGPQVLPRVLNLYQDDILILAGCALRDMMGDAAPPIRIDDAALVLVLGALLFVARGGEDGQPPVGHRRGSDT